MDPRWSQALRKLLIERVTKSPPKGKVDRSNRAGVSRINNLRKPLYRHRPYRAIKRRHLVTVVVMANQ